MKRKEYAVSSKFITYDSQAAKRKLEQCKIPTKGENDKCDVPYIADSAKKM